MRRLSIFLVFAFTLSFTSVLALAQSQTFTSENVDYTLELPSPTWRIVQEADSVHQHTEFIYGDRNDGYLKIRKEMVDEGTTATDLARRDQEQKLRFMPGYVDGKQERFADA